MGEEADKSLEEGKRGEGEEEWARKRKEGKGRLYGKDDFRNFGDSYASSLAVFDVTRGRSFNEMCFLQCPYCGGIPKTHFQFVCVIPFFLK